MTITETIPVTTIEPPAPDEPVVRLAPLFLPLAVFAALGAMYAQFARHASGDATALTVGAAMCSMVAVVSTVARRRLDRAPQD